MKKLTIALALAMPFCMLSCGGESTDEASQESTSEATSQTEEPEIMTTASGVKFQDLVAGTGEECTVGSRVECHYTLWFATPEGEKETRFQSSKDGAGTPFQCTLGQGLIQGWSDGMAGMKEGGTRRLIIPPELGYGQGGRGIPANQTLVFEIDFLKLVTP